MLLLVYNLALGLVEVALGVRAARSRRSTDALILVGASAVGAFLFALVIAGGPGFRMLRLLSWGLFGHVVVSLVAAAVLTRRTRWMAAIFAACAIAGGSIGVYAFRIEPFMLEVSRYRIETEKLDRPLRVAVLADFQSDEIGDYERRVIRTVAAQDADLILMPGDYIQEPDPRKRDRLRIALRKVLRAERFGAPLGAYAVQGNTEPPDWPATFDGLPVTAMTSMQNLSAGPLSITGLTLDESFDPRLEVPAADGFHIAFGHAPDFAQGDVNADLLVAGHTHGGQVRLPFVGPLITLSSVPKSWAAGRTQLDGGRTLIVSRGTGMERQDAPRLRFLCRPEIVVIDLVPAP